MKGTGDVRHMEDTIILNTFQVQPRCIKCGSDNLLMPDGALDQSDLADDSPITCGGCGAIYTYVELVEACEASKANDLINGTGAG